MTYRDFTPEYDPNIQSLVDLSAEQWGDPEINRGNLVPYGIAQFDQALYGMDITYGELDLIIGPEKQRKTTMALNIIANYMSSPFPVEKPLTVIDTLESGMKPEKYKDALISIVATRWLMGKGHSPRNNCRACGSEQCREIGISPDFLRYNTRTAVQKASIDYALETVREWPIMIYGANLKQGDTRNLNKAMQTIESRWPIIIQELGAKIFVTDHVQQYQLVQGVASDYEKQIQAVAAVGDVVSQWNIVCLMLSQISLTSIRDARNQSGKLIASGGSKAHQEANVIFSVAYKSGEGIMKMAIEEARNASSFAVWQTIEDVSGSFYGESKTSIDPADQPLKEGQQQLTFNN